MKTSRNTVRCHLFSSVILNRCLTLGLILVGLLLIPGMEIQAQSCPTSGNGSHTIMASISNNSSSVALPENAIFQTGGTLRIDATATTSGHCETACTRYDNRVTTSQFGLTSQRVADSMERQE
ncbi:MAG: hypothetical protein DMF69_03265 [Acidobacteria bacterium]|nr:MAG: hypothetical protein DMF69_03265 [Acidobacteriota bacterium]